MWFFRLSLDIPFLARVPVYIDNEKVADLRNGRFIEMPIEPGKHICRSRSEKKGTPVETEPGAEYYFVVDAPGGRLVRVTKEWGAAHIKALKPLDAKDISPSARMPN